MEKYDYKFGENICTPLNEYFISYIGEIIDNITLLKSDILITSTDEELKDIIIKEATPYIERKYWCITKQTFERIFSENPSMIEKIRNVCITLSEIRQIMKNTN